MSGRNNASLDIIKKININFPEYTLEWLIKGDEKPLHHSETKSLEKKIEKKHSKSMIKKIELVNPSNKAVALDYTSSNSINFMIFP